MTSRTDVPGDTTGAGLGWPAMLSAACTGSGVHSVYQPIVDVVRGTVAGYEALVRFDRGPANPEIWFNAARARGLEAELDAAALRSALRHRNSLPSNTFLTVNVGPMSLTHPLVRSVWAEQGSLGGVVIELTEQTPVESYGALLSDISRLRAAGAMIAVDDAGSGYAGLTHLLAIRPEIVKLDRALVMDVDRDETKRALVEMMGTLSSRIDAWLLAEGIERPGELNTLADLGVPLVQGYHLGRPAPAWAPLDTDAALHLFSRRSVRAVAGTLRSIVEVAPVVRSMAEVGDRFAGSTEVIVLVDDDNRPVSAITAESALIGQGHPTFKVNVDTPIAEAALRCLTRDQTDRFTPMLCTDAAGRYVGVVPVERLIQSMAQAGLTQAAPTAAACSGTLSPGVPVADTTIASASTAV